LAAALALSASMAASAQDFKLNDDGYFNCGGTDVMSFSDFYPEGHQGGVSIIINGRRIATNGDIRLEPTPGQWQPVPKQIERKVADGKIVTTLCYPDSTRHLTGFNPMIYPDLQLRYDVSVEADGDGVLVRVSLQDPVPSGYLGKVGFNLEFFPGLLFGKPWLMDGESGIYPQQPNGPVNLSRSNTEHPGDFHIEGKPLADIQMLRGESGKYSPIVADDMVAVPYAEGKRFTSRPDDDGQRVTVELVKGGDLKLYDGRMNHNNGWFVLRSEIPAGATRDAVVWRIRPAKSSDWRYKPVIQTSQVGYLPNSSKVAVIECDARMKVTDDFRVYRIEADGERMVFSAPVRQWGKFLRYNYLQADFSSVKEPGLYKVRIQDSESSVFRIDDNVFDRGVWQPVIEYFLPVQMCHMRTTEKYKVWHDLCHNDDALMAEPGNYFDGYSQEPGNWRHKPGDRVEGVNAGGWHDAGDFDLRVESQAGECYLLSLAFEEFKYYIDVTSIDQKNKVCEIHQPDGKNDILQQIEHGAISVVGGYLALGRLYRGIICTNLRQYCLLGDASAMTDRIPGTADDRRIFTEHNPWRELSTARNLAGTARALRGYNDTLSTHCLDIAKELFSQASDTSAFVRMLKLQTASELYITTGGREYLDFMIANKDLMTVSTARSGCWYLARVERMVSALKDKKVRQWCEAYRKALLEYKQGLSKTVTETPYGVPYHPSIWGAGWDVQRFGFEHYFLAKNYPDIFDSKPVSNALNFVLGCHPGSNTESFASGVGAKSATIGYGLNRADWSYIPGGVVSGTALIRPDFPELLEFPFLWQQKEYVLGGGSSHYMFLVMAVEQLERE